MKLLFDFLPIICFFAAFKAKGIYVATAVAIAVSVLQIAVSLLRKKRPEPMMILSFFVVLVFGGATLLLKNELFIKWKPTVLYALLAGILIGGRVFFGKNLVETMLAKQLALPERAWRMLLVAWSAFFIVVGLLNIVVAYHFPTATWVNFKLFGILGLTLLFAVVQGLLLVPYVEKDRPAAPPEEHP